jgi:hypothetical protein
VVLIESGAVPPGLAFPDLTRLNYVALLSVLHGLAENDGASEDAALYEGLARNADGAFVDVLLEGGRVLQPPAGDAYRADLAFDVLDEDTRLAACAAPGPPGPSRIRELGDGRLLAAARRRDVSGRLLMPALAASVRGLEARAWLDAGTLDAASRLGVARVRWHVSGEDREAALAAAARLAAPGRAALEVAEPGAPEHALVMPGPPALPRAEREPVMLAAAVVALTHGGSPALSGVSAAERLRALVGTPPGAGPPLRPDARASVLVLRPTAGESQDPGSLAIETVFLDGREVGGAR